MLGAAALTGGAIARPAAARAAESGSATSAPGVYEFNQEWLFGGVYAGGAEAPDYAESGVTGVTLPHMGTGRVRHDDYHSTNGSSEAALLAPLGGVPYLVTEAVGALDRAAVSLGRH